MSGKLVFIVGLMGIGGYVGHKAMNYDSTLYNYSREQVVTMLEGAKTTLPRRDGPGEIKIWSAGRSSDGVQLNMRYAEWAPLLECKAVVTEVAADQTRVVPDCGVDSDSGSAIANTTAQLRVPMFQEHIESTLQQRPFDRSRATAKETAAVLSNMPGMQREALKRHDEAQEMHAQMSESGSGSNN